MNILIIDDDLAGVEYLSTFLHLEGFTVLTAAAGSDGLELIQRQTPDVMILDVLLPGEDGWDICRQIRCLSDVPILMLTCYATETRHQIQGLGCGADDYMLKPVDFDLLKARIEALLRRTTASKGYVTPIGYSDDYLTVDVVNRQVRIKGEHISLSYLEYLLLEMLVRNSDQTVSGSKIIERLWPGQIYLNGQASLRTYIKRLRQLIEPDPKKPRYIVNEHGLGYRFVTQGNVHNSFTNLP